MKFLKNWLNMIIFFTRWYDLISSACIGINVEKRLLVERIVVVD